MKVTKALLSHFDCLALVAKAICMKDNDFTKEPFVGLFHDNRYLVKLIRNYG